MTDTNIQTTVFTACDKFYEPFVLPYIISTLYFNEDATIEICVEDSSEFKSNNNNALNLLIDHFGERVQISTSQLVNRFRNSARFLEQPTNLTKYTYIGDIDILVLEWISQQHIDHMQETGLQYSNIRRPGRDALTGLHFTRSDSYYPQALPSEDMFGFDEPLLFQLVANKGLSLPDINDKFRPVHGYHLSLQRSPFGNDLGWGLHEKFLSPFTDLVKSSIWQDCFPLFDKGYKNLFASLEFCLEAKYSNIPYCRLVTKNSKLFFE